MTGSPESRSPGAILAELQTIFQDVFDDPRLEIGEETAARDIPEWDSFNQINIVVAAEGRFAVHFTTTEIEALREVGDFVRLIVAKLEAQG